MADEKYISIEYNKWRDYYKPMEKRYEELLQKYIALEKKSREDAIEEIYNRYNSENNLLVIQTEKYSSYPNYYDKTYIFSIGLTDGAKKLAYSMYDKKMKSVPNWIKKLFKL